MVSPAVVGVFDSTHHHRQRKALRRHAWRRGVLRWKNPVMDDEDDKLAQEEREQIQREDELLYQKIGHVVVQAGRIERKLPRIAAEITGLPSTYESLSGIPSVQRVRAELTTIVRESTLPTSVDITQWAILNDRIGDLLEKRNQIVHGYGIAISDDFSGDFVFLRPRRGGVEERSKHDFSSLDQLAADLGAVVGDLTALMINIQAARREGPALRFPYRITDKA